MDRLRHGLATAALLVLCAAAAGGAAAAAAPPAGARPRRVLVVTETHEYRHASIPAALRLVRSLDRADRRYRLTFLADSRGLTARRLRHADAALFLISQGDLSLGERQRSRFLRWIRAGHGFAAFHNAVHAPRWPAYTRMIGGAFLAHPFVGPGRVIVEDRGHAATGALPGAFGIAEEFYFFSFDPRCCSHVLARLDMSAFGRPADEDRPLVWCRRAGRGRVFYDALGHNPATWRDRHQRRLVAGGLAWTLGRDRAGDRACARGTSPVRAAGKGAAGRTGSRNAKGPPRRTAHS